MGNVKDFAPRNAQTGAQKQRYRIDARSIVGYAVRSANVFLQGLTGTSMSALATETRRITRASLSALEIN